MNNEYTERLQRMKAEKAAKEKAAKEAAVEKAENERKAEEERQRLERQKEEEEKKKAEEAERAAREADEERRRVEEEKEFEDSFRKQLEETGLSSVALVAEKVWKADRLRKATAAVETAVALWMEGREYVGEEFRAELDGWLVEVRSWGNELPMAFRPDGMTEPEYMLEENLLGQLADDEAASQAEVDKRDTAALEGGESEVEGDESRADGVVAVIGAGAKRKDPPIIDVDDSVGDESDAESDEPEHIPAASRGGFARKTTQRAPQKVPIIELTLSPRKKVMATGRTAPIGNESEVSDESELFGVG